MSGTTTPYFRSKSGATGKVGFTSYRKCPAAIRVLAYGVSGDLIDEYLRMRETTYLDVMYKFCPAMIAVFGKVYLRGPTTAETAWMLSISEARWFLGMIGNIDCMLG
jgi:hypothetical protein